MKKLTREQIDNKDKLTFQLENASDEVSSAVHLLNQHLAHEWGLVEAAQERYQELIGEANAFIQDVQADQEQYLGDRSDAWHDSESGRAYKEWAAAWSVSLDAIDCCCPDDMDMPEMEAADILRELSVMPE